MGENWAKVTNCYSSGMVSGAWHGGGLVGFNRGTIATSYSASKVSGTESMGGLLAVAGGLPGMSVVLDSFWDTQTSGQTASAGGTGKTTAEMKMAKTFLDAGWDFVGETVSGTEDTWGINEGKDYPRLWWELPAAK